MSRRAAEWGYPREGDEILSEPERVVTHHGENRDESSYRVISREGGADVEADRGHVEIVSESSEHDGNCYRHATDREGL